MPDYLLITPVLNEQENIGKCISSVISQTKLPVQWVIIDGGSTDKTTEIITSFGYPWITVVSQSSTALKRGHQKFAMQMKEAYEYGKEISVEYIGKLDADCTIPPIFFETLINECEKDQALGAASGQILNDDIPEIYPEDEMPDIRLYRKPALEQIGGFPLAKYSPDTIILAKLRMNGWKVKVFPQVKISNMRKNQNNWKQAVTFGEARYYLGYSLLLFLLGCGYATRNNGIGFGIGLLYGYFRSVISRVNRIEDKLIYEYFHKTRLREVFKKQVCL